MGDGLPFIPAKLDDAGLSASQFRVFARIARRGMCSESVPNIASGCRLDQDTVWSALRSLLDLGMISKTSRPGATSVYAAQSPEQWAPTRNGGAPETAGRVVNSGATHPKERGGTHPKGRGAKVPLEGFPLKGHQIELLPIELPPSIRTERLTAKFSDWMAFRRKLKGCKDFPAMFREQATFLARFDEPTAFEVLSQSIRNGWQGLFEPRNNHANHGSTNKPNPRNACLVTDEIQQGLEAKAIMARRSAAPGA